jgi:hypothetical protein
MPSTLAPFGLRPIRHINGGAAVQIETATIASGYASTIYQHAPVKMGTDGTLQLAANGERFVGVFLGVEYVDSDNNRRVTNKWTASTTLQSGTTAKAMFTRDPGIIYEIQADGNDLALTSVGNCADFVATGANGYDDGNATTGLSEASLDASTAATTMAQLQIVGIGKRPDNSIDDEYPVVEVIISEHQLTASATAGV